MIRRALSMTQMQFGAVGGRGGLRGEGYGALDEALFG